METKVLYKPGYYIRATTWENDGDNYNTKEKFFGDDQHTVDMLTTVIAAMTEQDIGNITSYDNGSEMEEAKGFVEGVLFNDPRFQSFVVHNPSAVNIVFNHLYSLGFSSEDFSLRVCEKLEVLFIETPIEVKYKEIL